MGRHLQLGPRRRTQGIMARNGSPACTRDKAAGLVSWYLRRVACEEEGIEYFVTTLLPG